MKLNLKKLRTELGWKQTQLANYMGYKRHAIINVENGVSIMSDEFKKRLTNAIRVHISDAEKILQKIENNA